MGGADVTRYELWQDGVMVASAEGEEETARKEIWHYAMFYGQDGPVEIRSNGGDIRQPKDVT